MKQLESIVTEKKMENKKVKLIQDTFLDETIFSYLDELRDSGVTNMFGAGKYLEQDFGMKKTVAKEYLLKWMGGYHERNNKEESQ